MALPLIGTLGSYLASEGGGALAGAALPYLPDIARGAYNNIALPAINSIDRSFLTPFNKWAYPEQNHQPANLQRWQSPQEQNQQQFESSPERKAQIGLLNQLQQPQTSSFDAIRDKYLRQHQNVTRPSIMNRFAGMNNSNSGSARNALQESDTELLSQLAALEAEFGQRNTGNELNRLQQLGGYLGGQQQLGLQNQQAQAQQQQFKQNLALQQLGLGARQSNSDMETAIKLLLANQQRISTGVSADLENQRQGLAQTQQPVYSRGKPGLLNNTVGAAAAAFRK